MSAGQANGNLFHGLVVSLAAAAVQHMGKTLNPLTNKVEKNLDAAQSTIDMLDMLEAKTKGNLSDAEAKLLKNVLAELKLNYVETMNEKPADEPKPAAAEPPAAEPKAEEKPDAKPEQAG